MAQNHELSLVDLHEREFRLLTQRASLAVVARAARRILPLLVQDDSEIAWYWPAEGAIRLAETLASGGFITAHDAQNAQKALGLDGEDDLWREWTTTRTAFHVRACAEHVILAAGFVASAVDDDCATCPREQREEMARQVPRAAAVAGLEALEALRSVHMRMESTDLLLEKERGLLATTSPSTYRDLGRSIDPGPEGPLGPLWPAGNPSWYRLPPYSVQVAKGLPPDASPRSSPVPDPDMFVASAQAAEFALRCQDKSGREAIPDLRVTSHRVLPRRGKPAQRLEVAREAIGERLVRLVSGLGTEAALAENPPTRVLVLRDPHHFSAEVEQRLTERLGLSSSADAFAEFRTILADEFYRWLRDHSGQRQRMRGEFEEEQFFVRCPVLRRRGQGG